jgi:hypothetical protein
MTTSWGAMPEEIILRMAVLGLHCFAVAAG